MTRSFNVAFALIVGSYLAGAASPGRAQTLCSDAEANLFSCKLKGSGKVVSLCASTDLGKGVGFLQYRFGSAGKVELSVPSEKTGKPDLMLTRSADVHAEYNDLTFSVGHFTYELTSFRRLTAKNGDGLPTPESSDSLSVRDDRKSMKEGDIVFSGDCETLGAAINVLEIGNRTGLTVQKGGF